MTSNETIKPLSSWLDTEHGPVVISGPCSAESRDQVLATALELKTIPQVKMFRAGIWKPRTRPGGFEGMGDEALKWLREVKDITGLKITVEVASPAHIEKCLKHGIDALWIGARTVVNPFSMDELSEAVRGTRIPVMIKNPVNPDLDLWIGAIERIQKAGISCIAAVHRGFYCSSPQQYRNNPLWEIPIELKRIRPELPLICDPSHIAGNTNDLLSLSQYALDLMMDGLMIETHIHPEKALTDARQQITPAKLNELLLQLSLRRKESPSPLDQLRQQIDKLDLELLKILAQRIEIVKHLAAEKKNQNTTIYQAERWRQLIEDRLQKAQSLDLDSAFVLKLLQIVHRESIRIQSELYRHEND